MCIESEMTSHIFKYIDWKLKHYLNDKLNMFKRNESNKILLMLSSQAERMKKSPLLCTSQDMDL